MKKYLALCLSLCVFSSSCIPLSANAEAIDNSIASADDVLEEEIEDASYCNMEETNILQEETSDIEDEENVMILEGQNVYEESEQIFESENEVIDNQVQESTKNFINLYSESVVEQNEYTQVIYAGTARNYGYKYDPETQTLKIKVWDGESAEIEGGARAFATTTGLIYSASAPNGLPKEEIENVKKIVVESGITKISNRAFQGTSYKSLEEVELPDSLTELGFSVFDQTQLRYVDCKNIQKVGNTVFQNCKQLKQVAFNNADIVFGTGVFNGDASLENICYAGTSTKWKEISNDADISVNTKIHCKEDIQKPIAATCTETGLKELICPVCSESYTDGTKLPALGHKFSDDYTVDKVATCTEEGEKSKHCTREECDGREDIQTIPVDKENHDWISEVTTQPTCTKTGVRTYTCSRCKDTKTEKIPATGKHQWTNWKKTADATVFAAGKQERTCAICSKKETRTVGKKLTATATINASSVTLKEKQNTSFVKVTGLAKGDSIKTWKSTNTKVFTVTGKADGTCKLTGVKKGTAKLEITLASGLKKTVTVKVQTKTVTTSNISGLEKKMTVKKGTKATLKPVITPATSQQKVTYSSSNKKVATVSSKGVITAKKAGTAKITVKSGSKKVTVTVTVPKTKTTAIVVGDNVSVKKGKTYSLKAKVTPSNSDEKITYSTSNKKIATVSKFGKIKGVKKGTATITIKSGKITKKVKVTVK